MTLSSELLFVQELIVRSENVFLIALSALPALPALPTRFVPVWCDNTRLSAQHLGYIRTFSDYVLGLSSILQL